MLRGATCRGFSITKLLVRCSAVWAEAMYGVLKRMPQYAHADYVVEVDGMTTSQAVDDIIAWLHKKKIHL